MNKWAYRGAHAGAWCLILLNSTWGFYTTHNEKIDQAIMATSLNRAMYVFIFTLAYFLVFFVAFYGCFIFVGPALFSKKKYLKASIYFLLVLVAMIVTRYVVEFYFILPWLKFDNYNGNPISAWYYIQNCVQFTYKYCLLGLVAYFLIAMDRIDKEKREIEKEKIRAELSFLRTQVNPHFLFNTINDIYTLSYQKDDKAPEALLKLSVLLRYMLQENGHAKVKVAEEIAYLKNYIELQEIGCKGKMYVRLVVDGELQNAEIAPLLLIPFVENIFKHGITDDDSYPANIYISINKGRLSFTCSNKVREQHKDNVSGIGLSNVRRRLELLYPYKHKFVIEEMDNTFACSLQLDLNSLI